MNGAYVKEIMSEYFNVYKANPNVLAILITGSYGRGEADSYSDVDWVCVVEKKRTLGGKELFKGVQFDCRVEDVEHLKNDRWSMDQFFAYLNCKIFFEKDGIFSSIILKKQNTWEDYVKKCVSVKLVELSVFIHFPSYYHELQVDETHFDRFIKRRDFESSFNCLLIIRAYLIELSYLCNKYPVPDLKNRVRNIERYDFCNVIRDCLSIPYTKKQKELVEFYEMLEVVLRRLLKYYDNNFVKKEDLKEQYYKYRDEVNR